jgi:hypothetical protein
MWLLSVLIRLRERMYLAPHEVDMVLPMLEVMGDS